MEFLNTEPEANNDFWLWLDDEEERLYPEDISSPDIQKAVNVFCMDTFQFLRQHCPEHEDQLLLALRQNQTVSELLYLPHSCSKSMKELAWLISDWCSDVFQYQLLADTYQDSDIAVMPEDVCWILNHRDITDIPRRTEAMRRLREMWEQIPSGANVVTISRKCGRIDMQDWISAMENAA